jgi:hypothetical protein
MYQHLWQGSREEEVGDWTLISIPFPIFGALVPLTYCEETDRGEVSEQQ